MRPSALPPLAFGCAVAAALVGVSCSGSEPRPNPLGSGSGGNANPGAGGSPLGSGAAAAGTGAESSTSAGGRTGFQQPNGGTMTVTPDAGCATQTTSGELIPLDMYVMLDSSGSMLELTGPGPSKWNAVLQALEDFLNDPRTTGLGMGIQFFPLPGRDLPASCRSDADCGGGKYGFCALQFCSTPIETPDGLAVLPCQVNAQCQIEGLGSCDTFGECEGDPESLCYPPTGFCDTIPRTACVPITESQCTDPDCDVGVYSTPSVAIAPLPGNAQPIADAINLQAPAGRTPTAASLQGALDYATQFASQNPSHRVIVVYVTDGLPTECTPFETADIAAIARSGVTGMPRIQTFAIGVFAPTAEGAQGRDTVGAIAAAGGTTEAFIVDPGGNVATQFLDALDQIRSGTVGCEFQIPDPPEGDTLDYSRVNVTFESSGGLETLPFVASPDDCSAVDQGWHYDVSPSSGSPKAIVACPQTCELLKASVGARVEITLGCETEIAVPR